jgi:hypothetical protein
MKRLRRNEVIHAHQTEFSPILFDMLFGLLIFLGFSSFARLDGSTHFVFIASAIAVAVHWWLKRKAAVDTFGIEVGNSTLSLLFGIAEIVLLQMAMLAAAEAEYETAVTYFAMPIVLESVWALLLRFFGNWRHSTAKRVRYMEQQLEYVVFLNLVVGVILGAIVTFSPLMTAPDIVLSFILGYAAYVLLTYRLEIVDVKML